MPDETKEKEDIKLSTYTKALLENIKSLKPKSLPDEFSKLTVSQTVSFLAFAYEKVRNAVEYREEHQIRRATIERILKRRLSLNPTGKGEAENILRELLWARYFDSGTLGLEDVKVIQEIMDRYLSIRKSIIKGRSSQTRTYLTQFIMDLMTCEIEEILAPLQSNRNAAFTFFIFQVLKDKVKIEGINEDQKNVFFLNAIEKSFRKSDSSYRRYHIFITFYNPLNSYKDSEISSLQTKLPDIFKKIDEMIKSPYVENLSRYVKKQLPPFLILFEIVRNNKRPEEILANKNKLWTEVDKICREKYQQITERLKNLAIKSFIYIFLTKMIFAVILEYPVSNALYGEVHTTSIIINSVFPPILMLIIVSFFRTPGEDNTKKIYQRLTNIIDEERSFETQIAYMPKKARVRRPILVFGFTIFYSLTFIITLILINRVLVLLKFNLVSQAIFIFFVSVVTFFSYRIKQIVNEYRLLEKENILTPLADFFFMPVLSLGKFFSSEIARLNFFIVVFDFLIEAPFKFVFEIVEEWISFVKKRKEEII